MGLGASVLLEVTSGTLINLLSIVVDLNKATRILGLMAIRHQYQHDKKTMDDNAE